MWRYYRKKPVVIRAVRYDGVNVSEIRTFTIGKAKIENKVGSSQDGEGYPQRYIEIIIPTLEGDHLISEGDWVIEGVKGEFYPCKPDIFEQTYEEAK